MHAATHGPTYTGVPAYTKAHKERKRGEGRSRGEGGVGGEKRGTAGVCERRGKMETFVM